MDESGGMKEADPHHGHRFPAKIISHAVWLYHVFSLSLRDVEMILAKRGVLVTHGTIRPSLSVQLCPFYVVTPYSIMPL
jgi:transposase-like protein